MSVTEESPRLWWQSRLERCSATAQAGVRRAVLLSPAPSGPPPPFPTHKPKNTRRLPEEEKKQKPAGWLMRAEEEGNQRWRLLLLRVSPTRVPDLVRCSTPFGGTPAFIRYPGSEKKKKTYQFLSEHQISILITKWQHSY